MFSFLSSTGAASAPALRLPLDSASCASLQLAAGDIEAAVKKHVHSTLSPSSRVLLWTRGTASHARWSLAFSTTFFTHGASLHFIDEQSCSDLQQVVNTLEETTNNTRPALVAQLRSRVEPLLHAAKVLRARVWLVDVHVLRALQVLRQCDDQDLRVSKRPGGVEMIFTVDGEENEVRFVVPGAKRVPLDGELVALSSVQVEEDDVDHPFSNDEEDPFGEEEDPFADDDGEDPFGEEPVVVEEVSPPPPSLIVPADGATKAGRYCMLSEEALVQVGDSIVGELGVQAGDVVLCSPRFSGSLTLAVCAAVLKAGAALCWSELPQTQIQHAVAAVVTAGDIHTFHARMRLDKLLPWTPLAVPKLLCLGAVPRALLSPFIACSYPSQPTEVAPTEVRVVWGPAEAAYASHSSQWVGPPPLAARLRFDLDGLARFWAVRPRGTLRDVYQPLYADFMERIAGEDFNESGFQHLVRVLFEREYDALYFAEMRDAFYRLSPNPPSEVQFINIAHWVFGSAVTNELLTHELQIMSGLPTDAGRGASFGERIEVYRSLYPLLRDQPHHHSLLDDLVLLYYSCPNMSIFAPLVWFIKEYFVRDGVLRSARLTEKEFVLAMFWLHALEGPADEPPMRVWQPFKDELDQVFGATGPDEPDSAGTARPLVVGDKVDAHVLAHVWDAEQSIKVRGARVSVGQPLFDTQCMLEQLDGEVLQAPGVPGELCVRGPLVCTELVAKSKQRAATVNEDGFVHTGYRVELDDSGDTVLLGRFVGSDCKLLQSSRKKRAAKAKKALKKRREQQQAREAMQNRQSSSASRGDVLDAKLELFTLVTNDDNASAVFKILEAKGGGDEVGGWKWSLVTARDSISRRSALHVACEYGASDVAEVLLDAGADVNGMGGRRLRVTPIADAIVHGDLNMVRFLVSKGGNPKLVAKHETSLKHGYNGLHLAVAYGHAHIAEYLISELRMSVREPVHNTQAPLEPIHIALFGVVNVVEQVVLVLLRHGASIEPVTDERVIEAICRMELDAEHLDDEDEADETDEPAAEKEMSGMKLYTVEALRDGSIFLRSEYRPILERGLVELGTNLYPKLLEHSSLDPDAARIVLRYVCMLEEGETVPNAWWEEADAASKPPLRLITSRFESDSEDSDQELDELSEDDDIAAPVAHHGTLPVADLQDMVAAVEAVADVATAAAAWLVSSDEEEPNEDGFARLADPTGDDANHLHDFSDDDDGFHDAADDLVGYAQHLDDDDEDEEAKEEEAEGEEEEDGGGFEDL